MDNPLQIPIKNYKFNCRIEGDSSNELVIFLHGFPESAYMWRNLMKAIAKKNFFCVAPNLRGYSKEACPKGKTNYTIDKLVNDVIEISQYFGKDKFHLVGHDWGAAIGWKTAHDYKERIYSFTGISVPHLQSFGVAMEKDGEQRKMSAYIRNFQWPLLPEKQLRKHDFEVFKKLWKHSDESEINNYLSIFRNKSQLTGAINYYRANYKFLKSATKKQILGNIDVPTLFIWGNKDLAIGSYSVNNSHQYMKNHYEFIELGAGHWLIQTNYNDILTAVSKHLTAFQNKVK